MKNLTLALLLCSAFSLQSNAAIWYVKIDAAGSNNGTSWEDAYTDLQSAIAASTFGDDIWVAQGTYKPTSTTSRSISFVIKNGTKLYGGFLGTESNLSERNHAVNITILSGDINTGAANDNSYKVVSFNNVTNQTRLDGFSIMGGYATSYGGGVLSTNSSPVIANCNFIGNYAAEGGGALNHSGSGILTLESCIFDGNVGNTYGGGALRLYAGPVNISNCYFKSNQSNTYGGAIFAYGPVVNITNSVFAGNVSQTTGAAIRIGDTGTLHLNNSLLVGNFTNGDEIIYASTASNSSAHTIKNTTIAHNKIANSGNTTYPTAVALNAQATITNSIIYGNTSPIQVLGNGITFTHNISQQAQSGATSATTIHADPQFINPGIAANAPFDTTGLNYNVGLFSPAINSGLNANVTGTLDLAGNPRIQDNTVDRGAYERTYCNSTSTFAETAPYAICGGTPITLSIPDATSLLWSTGQTTNSIHVTSAGTITVVFEDENGCRGTAQAVVTSSPNPTPSITFSAGSLSVGSYATHQWSFNGSEITNATTNSHTPLEGYGAYSIVVTNNNGCSASATYCLSPATLTASGPTTFCEGESVTLTATNGSSQVWSTGSLDPSISVTSQGTYSVTVMNAAAGCSVNLQQVVNVNPNPNPTITLTGANLVTGSFASYQWFLNGNPIPGAIQDVFTPTENGQYTVAVVSGTSCEGTSAVFNLTNVGLTILSEDLFEMFPNPISGNENLYFNWNTQSAQDVLIMLYDVTGAMVYQQKTEVLPEFIVIPNLETGVYFVSFEINNKSTANRKLIIQ